MLQIQGLNYEELIAEHQRALESHLCDVPVDTSGCDCGPQTPTLDDGGTVPAELAGLGVQPGDWQAFKNEAESIMQENEKQASSYRRLILIVPLLLVIAVVVIMFVNGELPPKALNTDSMKTIATQFLEIANVHPVPEVSMASSFLVFCYVICKKRKLDIASQGELAESCKRRLGRSGISVMWNRGGKRRIAHFRLYRADGADSASIVA